MTAKQWLSAAELAGLPAMPKTVQGVALRAEANGWKLRKRAGRGGGREYALESLPAETRAELARRIATDAARAGRSQARLVSTAAQLSADDKHAARVQSLAKLGTATGWVKQHIDARLAVLSAFDAYHTAHGGAITTSRTLFAQSYNAGEIEVSEEVRATIPMVSLASLMRWATGVEKSGLAGLAPRYGNRKNACLILTQQPVHDLVVGMLTQYPHCSVPHVMQAIEARCKGTKLKLPKLRTVQRFLARWKQNNAQLYSALTNPDQWRNHYKAAAGSASAGIERLNQRWETDSTPGDLLLADGQRHAIIGVIDVYSRRMKLLVSRTSRASAIASVMRRAITDWGVPEQIKSDNGSDYVSLHLKRIYKALDIEHLICRPFTPEQKPHIERGLGTMSHDMIELLPGYIGHDVAQRKDIEARRSFAQRLMEGKPVELRCTPEQLQNILDDWCAMYHEREHRGLEGATPNSRVHGQHVRRIEDERALDVLLQPVAGGNRDGWHTVTKKGVRIDRGTYNHADLGGLEGKRVLALRDEADWGYVYLFNEAGDFVCKAFDPDRLGIAHGEVAMARRARQSNVLREGKAYVKAAQKRAHIDDIVPDILASRAAAASNVISLNPASTYTTPALQQAAIAASNQVAQVDIDAAALQALQSEMTESTQHSAHATVMHLPSGQGRWAFCKTLHARVAAGERVSARDWDWAQRYALSDEYKSMEEMAADFALAPEGVLHDLGVAM